MTSKGPAAKEPTGRLSASSPLRAGDEARRANYKGDRKLVGTRGVTMATRRKIKEVVRAEGIARGERVTRSDWLAAVIEVGLKKRAQVAELCSVRAPQPAVVNARVAEATVNEMDAAAEAAGVSRSDWLVAAIDLALKNRSEVAAMLRQLQERQPQLARTKDEIDEAAEAAGVSRSDWLAAAVGLALKNRTQVAAMLSLRRARQPQLPFDGQEVPESA